MFVTVSMFIVQIKLVLMFETNFIKKIRAASCMLISELLINFTAFLRRLKVQFLLLADILPEINRLLHSLRVIV